MMLCKNRVATPDRMREIEQYAIAEIGIPSFLLMEHASIAVVDEIEEMLKEKPQNVLFICGPGNNGGDGFSAARIFAIRGGKASVVITCDTESLKGDAKKSFELLKNYPISSYTINDMTLGETISQNSRFLEISTMFKNNFFDKPESKQIHLIVDALFGIGLTQPPDGIYADIILAVNALSSEYNVPVLSIDIASGVFAESGHVCVKKPGEYFYGKYAKAAYAVKATRTVTFQWAKPGHYIYPGREYSGEISIKPIGLMEQYPCKIDSIANKRNPTPDGPFVITRETVQKNDGTLLFNIKREANTHKGDYGHILVLAGSVGMAGAAVLCAKAALGSGAGLVTVACPESIVPIIQTLCPCAMAKGLPEHSGAISSEASKKISDLLNGKDIIAIGPGMGAASAEVLREVIKNGIKCVIDADGLKLLKELLSDIDELTNVVITPHPGEMAYLTDKPIEEIISDPIKAANEFADKYNTTVLLKGSTTVVSAKRAFIENGEKKYSVFTWLGTLGTPGMATGGSGDTLTGIIAARAAQTVSKTKKDVLSAKNNINDLYICENDVLFAYIIHSLAGEKAAQIKGETAMTANDIINSLPEVF